MHRLTKLSSFLLLGFILLGCSSGSTETPTKVVAPSEAGNDGSTASSNTSTGGTDTAESGSDSANTGTDIDTNTTSTADAQSSDGSTSDNGTNDSGANTGNTAGATTDGADTSDSITDGSDTSIAISDNGSDAADTTSGTDDDTSGTGGTITDTDGTTGTDGTGDDGSITSGASDYSAGSLAATLANRIDVMRAFSEVKAAGLDEELNNPNNSWTLFLPTNEAFAADTDFDIEKHLYKGASLGWYALSWYVGRPLSMSDGRELSVDGGVLKPLTIADATVLETDIDGDINSSVTVHVIDSIIGEYTGAPYPGYPQGSLADIVFQSEGQSALHRLRRDAQFDLTLNDPNLNWTIFLPNQAAFADAATDSFDITAHFYVESVLSVTDLNGLSGTAITMNNGVENVIGGGGSEPLTINGIPIIELGLRSNSGDGPIVYVIDGMLDTSEDTSGTGETTTDTTDASTDTDGATTGGGTGDDGSVISETSGYLVGSLADIVFQSDGRTALHRLRAESGLDRALDDPNLNWTIFLPNQAAFADAATDVFDITAHFYVESVLSVTDLNGLSGTAITMNNGVENVIGGGGSEPLTINGIPIIELGLRSNSGDGPIVYVIDGMLDSQ